MYFFYFPLRQQIEKRATRGSKMFGFYIAYCGRFVTTALNGELYSVYEGLMELHIFVLCATETGLKKIASTSA